MHLIISIDGLKIREEAYKDKKDQLRKYGFDFHPRQMVQISELCERNSCN